MSEAARRRQFQAPKGTRDLYPEDVLRRRYLLETLRRVATLHGFEEVDGPTFEELELYTVKSGEGIVSELFSFTRAGGEDTYALRPEFTPTGARLFAARARQLPQPTKWFQIGPRFRAERPQRGRLREFIQWDCDVYNDEGTPEARARADAELVAVCVDALRALGLTENDCTVRVSNRGTLASILTEIGVPEANVERAMVVLDRRAKQRPEEFAAAAREVGLDPAAFDAAAASYAGDAASRLFAERAEALGVSGWIRQDFSIVRGLAYYTGMVFEVIAEGERAVAGGGRYDKLVHLLGGPEANAVGFAMGDVVVSLLLEDKGLMPEGLELREAAAVVPASPRPDVFVVSADEALGDPLIDPLVAKLRRGIEAEGASNARPWSRGRYAVPPLHARRSSKSTRNLGKLLADAERQGARFAAVVHRDEVVQLKDLDRREDLGDFHVSERTSEYVGRIVVERLKR